MIDLNYHPKKQTKKSWEEEEIACAVLAIVLWIANVILFLRAL